LTLLRPRQTNAAATLAGSAEGFAVAVPEAKLSGAEFLAAS